MRGGDIVITLRLLGPFSVWRGGDAVEPSTFGGRLPQALLRLLATRRGTAVPFEVLVEALWPRRPPADPVANLNVLASRVRRATEAPPLITATDGGYVIPLTAPCVVDAEVFLDEVGRADRLVREGGHEAAATCFETALGRWTGEPLAEDLYADWAQPYRRRLLRERIHAVEASGALSLLAADFTTALRRAEEAVALEPLRESANILLMRALAAGGDPAAAVEAYTVYRLRLGDETGMDPSGEAEDFYLRLLRGDVAGPVARSSQGAAPGAPQGGFQSSVQRDYQGTPRGGLGVVPSRPVTGAAHGLPFVGREAELTTFLHGVSSPEPGIVVLEGAPGSGKSRLLAESIRRVDRPTVYARAFLAEREEVWGLARRLLREAIGADISAAVTLSDRFAVALAGVVPELAEIRDVPALAVEPASSRALVIEGAVRLLGAVVGDGVLIADDLQWTDAGSLAVLDRFGTRYPHAGVAVALRPQEVPADGPVWAFLDDAAHTVGLRRVSLGPLSAAAVAELVVGEDLAAALIRHTDRTPIALLESVRALADRGVLGRRNDGRWTATAGDVVELAVRAARDGHRYAIERRAAGLLPRSREVLCLLAALGRETSIQLLAEAVGGSTGDVLGDLDTLARAGLAALGERGWCPAHDVVAEAVLANLDDAALAKTHGTLARALAGESADQAEIARHLALAGDTGKASSAYADAARDRLAHFADAEAGRLADAGLDLQPRPAVQADLLATRAEARARAGDLARAAEDLRSALRSGSRGPGRAEILARHARLAVGAQDLASAGEFVRLALAEAGNDERARAAALYAGSIVDMNTDRAERARHRADEALELFERAGDAHGVADILDARAMATFLDGRIRDAADAFDRVARVFTDIGDLFRAVTPRSTRGHALVFMDDPGAALREIEEALEIARSLDRAEGMSYALWHRAEALAALGRIAEAVATADESGGIAERIGHRSWTVAAQRALGVALEARGDLDGAERAFRAALDGSTHWPLFISWSCARIGMVRMARGDYGGAEPHVRRALAEGPPLAHYEARLAGAEFAVARGDHDAARVVAEALSLAETGGHIASVARLRELAGRAGKDVSRLA